MAAFGRGGSTPPLPASSAITSLPATAGGLTRRGAWGFRQVSGWAGNCCIVRRVSDSAEQTIGFVNGEVDWEAIITFMGASTVRLKTLFDQFGGGFDATQTTSGSEPYIHPTKYIRGQRGITFFGGWMRIPDMGNNARNNCTLISIDSAISAGSNDTVLALANISHQSTSRVALMPNRTVLSKVLHSSFAGTVLSPPCSYGFHGATIGASNTIIYNDLLTPDNVAGTVTSVTSNGGFIGISSDSGYQGYHDGLLWAVYDGVATAAQMTAVATEVIATCNVRTNATSRMLVTGDSIAFGSQALSGLGFPRRVEDKIFANGFTQFEHKNTGVSGTLLSAHYSSRANMIPQGLAPAGLTKKLVRIEGGSNDFNFAVTGANLWTNTALPYIQYCQGLTTNNACVIINTIMNRSDYSGAEWTEAQAYNALLVSNQATYGYTLMDWAGLTVALADGIHPSDVGYETIAVYEAPIIEALL